LFSPENVAVLALQANGFKPAIIHRAKQIRSPVPHTLISRPPASNLVNILVLKFAGQGQQSRFIMNQEPIRISRQELYHEVWTKTLRKIGKELGTSYVELVRACATLNVPRPQPGHWENVRLGAPIQQAPLPDAGADTPLEVLLRPTGKVVEEELPELPEVAEVEIPAQPHSKDAKAKLTEKVESPIAAIETQGQEALIANNKPQIAAEEAAPAAPAKAERPRTVEYSREQLYEAIWSTPCLKLAASLGVSDVALAKTCRRSGVPRPPRGYWAKVEVAEKPPKERLPAAKPGQDRMIRFDVAENMARREEWAIHGLRTAGKSKKPNAVELPPEGSELHSIIEKQKRALEKAKPGDLGYVSIRGKDVFWCDVSLPVIPKLVRALDAIACELDDRDYEFEASDSDYSGLNVVRDKDRVELRWSEGKVEIEREPTNVDKRKPSWTWQLKETKPSGMLTIEVNADGLRGKRRWTEAEGRTLEEVLGVVVEKIETTFRGYKEQRQRAAQWAQEREEERKREAEREAKEAERKATEERRRKERERNARHEKKLEEIVEARRGNLANAAQMWIEAEGISAFVHICEQRWRNAGGGNLSPDQTQWLQWARAEAVRKDPRTVGYPDPGVDGKLDGASITVGGPYPDTREFEEDVPDERPEALEPEVKTVYVETPRPPEPFPYWHLHRKH
jgi:hypothetical protein